MPAGHELSGSSANNDDDDDDSSAGASACRDVVATFPHTSPLPITAGPERGQRRRPGPTPSKPGWAKEAGLGHR